jgi:hypothetical protein
MQLYAACSLAPPALGTCEHKFSSCTPGKARNNALAPTDYMRERKFIIIEVKMRYDLDALLRPGGSDLELVQFRKLAVGERCVCK